ncbi:HemK protein [Mycobacterium tuberculosis]|nr:HemK protein [Mycobacterium tuberculosis]
MTSAPATMRWGNLPLAGESGTMTLRQAIDLAAALLAEAGATRRVATLSSWPLT